MIDEITKRKQNEKEILQKYKLVTDNSNDKKFYNLRVQETEILKGYLVNRTDNVTTLALMYPFVDKMTWDPKIYCIVHNLRDKTQRIGNFVKDMESIFETRFNIVSFNNEYIVEAGMFFVCFQIFCILKNILCFLYVRTI